ncbi:MAG TPA: methyltransferase domain-containing protein [Stellaceae bacterium]|nr:methyltransferase domain-containing protein [Stellaceae bacterium]
MGNADTSFTGSIPALYDRYLGPLIFEEYARDLAERARALAPKRVLETAAGTGIVTRAICGALPGATIVATDLNQAMLDYAASRAAVGNVTWRQADAQALPFGDGEFDLVTCQFGAMFFPDKRRAYREAHRVLRSGGRFILSVWDRIEENEIADIVTKTLASLFPQNPPRFLVRTPYAYFNTDAIVEELRAAGFTQTETATLAKRSRAGSPRHPAIAFCQGTPLRGEIEALDKDSLERATDAAAAAIAARFGSGAIEGKIQAHVITATR